MLRRGNWRDNGQIGNTMADCDVVLIGAGHNALVCAGYLAKAGYKVIIVERRHTVGGAVVTEEIVPGFRFDLGGSAHILIHHTPILRDLNLAAYGLDYIDLDPLFFAPFPDGSHITIWKDIDRTCASIAAVSPVDAEAYRKFIQEWEPLAEGMVASFLEPPTVTNLVRNLVWKNKSTAENRLLKLSDILHGYGQVVRQTFTDRRVQAVIAWMAAQSGPPPGEPLSAPFALWHPMYHRSGMKRPRGGSGMLTQALARMIQAHGGHIIAGAPVQRILTQNNRAVGIETAGGIRISARAVVSGAHIHTTLSLLQGAAVARQARQLLARARVGNGFGMMVRYAMRELPNYYRAPDRSGRLSRPSTYGHAVHMS